MSVKNLKKRFAMICTRARINLLSDFIGLLFVNILMVRKSQNSIVHAAGISTLERVSVVSISIIESY